MDAEKLNFAKSYTQYQRRNTHAVQVGKIAIGGENPIRIQSMTTADTMDTKKSVDETLRMVDSGCELVRLTAPSIKEAENLREIKKQLLAKGCDVPLVADIHFTPNAAELAAEIVEKVRVNPGNYVDKKKFEEIEYTDESYQLELDRIKEKFSPLVLKCQKRGVAIRIGTNHGSLSDRIMSRYGDTPAGMVESALEFIRICEELEFFELIISMKSSNTQVMVQAYRLLAAELSKQGLKQYPFHLGVTEAGDGEDGRIKSAVGIGTLLEDGLGDTIRVSLTEDPEFEAPVAKKLADRYLNRENHQSIQILKELPYDPYSYKRRETTEVLNVGGANVPRVIADFSQETDLSVSALKAVGHHYIPLTDKWGMSDNGCDYLFLGDQKLDFMLPNGLKAIMNYATWLTSTDSHDFPLIHAKSLSSVTKFHKDLNFILVNAADLSSIAQIPDKNIVVVLESFNVHTMVEMRRWICEAMIQGKSFPIIPRIGYEISDLETFQLYSATDFGALTLDGLLDGVWLSNKSIPKEREFCNSTAFGILQAGRARITKTEYISCPSCGRTLFDLQETTAMIRKRTDHLKGVKIGIMGCIVNGPGEMADADFGYVGSGKGKITLYKGQEVVKRSVPSAKAVDELIELIKKSDAWVEPNIEK